MKFSNTAYNHRCPYFKGLELAGGWLIQKRREKLVKIVNH